jgi:dinuclear metal center YbgI/SA1388 family protein
MQLATLIDAMDLIAPTRYAEAWDNVGLLAGDPAQEVSRAMLCIDYTPEVACEAAGEKCDVIIAYHPPIFSPFKRITGPSLVFDAIRRSVAIYSPHTALDVAEGGTNDVLADAMGLTDRRPLRVGDAKATQLKLVTFVPERHVEEVATTLFDAGAGHIGDYSRCSFRSAGTGTFFGETGTKPTVGTSGEFERAAEIRLETVVPIARLSAVIAALRQSHPYEEPAFDLVQLAAPPETIGQGRIGTLPQIERGELFERIKNELGLTHLLISGPTSGPVSRAACCAGSGGEFLNDAIAAKADLYLSGEIRHHDAIQAAGAGMTVVCTLHSNSERAVLKRLMTRLMDQLPGLAVQVSQMDRDPFSVR